MNNDFNQNGYGQQNYNGQSYYGNQGYDPVAAVRARIEQLAESAFGKGLAATIMAWFPITSIIAIIMGAASKSTVNEAKQLAESYGMQGGGKYMAANVLSKVGLYGGIAMTVIWAIYIIYFIAIFAFMGNTGYYY